MTILSDTQIAGYAAGAGFTPDQVPTMVAIALAESGGNTDATHTNSNGTTDSGVWQINSVHKISGNLFDPAVNAAAARTVFNGQGFKAWSTYNSGRYTSFLGRGKAAASAAPITGSASGGTPNGATGAGTVDSSSLSTSVNSVTTGATWARIGEFALGSVLVIFAILRLTGADKMIIKGAKVAAVA